MRKTFLSLIALLSLTALTSCASTIGGLELSDERVSLIFFYTEN